MNTDSVDALLLLVIGLSVIVAVVSLIVNSVYSAKIVYYESPRGLIERVFNDSKEKEYWSLKNTSTTLYYVGMASLIMGIGGLGAYISRHRGENGESDTIV